jgi:sphingomyelin phosphodiesterase acid-like 3
MKRYLYLVPLLAILAGAARLPSSRNQFLWVSDVHFDPTPDMGLTDLLAKTDAENWTNVLAVSPFGQDTRWPLFASAVAAMREKAPDAQFMIVTGDVLAHELREKFEKTAIDHSDEAFRSFTTKTFEFVSKQLQSAIPGKPVLFTLGNNDSNCGDYYLEPHGPFLRDTADTVMKMLGPLADDSARSDWTSLGTYSVRHPALERVRIIALNSTFFSAKYENACVTDSASDPGRDEMDWLADKLARANERREKVWLMFHIAPGIDGYATAHPKGGGPDKPIVEMWKPKYTNQFQQLLEKYPDVVKISLAGHEHMDDFRLIDHSLVLLVPGLSPVVNQNPAFRVGTYTSGGELADAATYYLTNLNTFGGQNAAWQAEYSFGEKWGMKRLDYQSFEKLFHAVEENPAARTAWMNSYGVSRPEGHSITPETFPWLFCAAGNANDSGFQSCLQRLTTH